MILIADSGATKTDWRTIDANGNIGQHVTTGLNPYHLSRENISEVLINELIIDEPPSAIYFYGAGCSSPTNQSIISKELARTFPDAHIEIHTDILGAARSLCGNESGVVCILGTGTNACIYDGKVISQSLPSLGYVLGDEASGSWLGKKLISDYFGQRLSDINRKRFEDFGDYSKDFILNKVYQEPWPAAFLASYSKLISENVNDPYFYRLVYEGFELFIANIKTHFLQKSELPLHFTGSVAYIYSDILRKVASDMQVYVKNINQSPIAGLTLFHQLST